MKKLSLVILLLGTLFCYAQDNDPVVRYRFSNDTLFLICESDYYPQHVVIQTEDRTNIYKRIFNDETDDLMEDHPAADIYAGSWTSAHVNPYHISIDSLQDSVALDLHGFVMPHNGYITSKFGPRKYRYHYGTDIKVLIGDTIRAAWDGQVRIVDYDARGYGNYMVIRHDNGLETVYAHLSRVLFEENDRVFAGEAIALGGNTGRSTGSHLHFETRYLGNAFNSELLINYETHQLHYANYLLTKRGTFAHHAKVKELQAAKYITIKSGDNLSTLARRHGTTVKTLCKLNGIKETSILRIGQRLRVR